MFLLQTHTPRATTNLLQHEPRTRTTHASLILPPLPSVSRMLRFSRSPGKQQKTYSALLYHSTLCFQVLKMAGRGSVGTNRVCGTCLPVHKKPAPSFASLLLDCQSTSRRESSRLASRHFTPRVVKETKRSLLLQRCSNDEYRRLCRDSRCREVDVASRRAMSFAVADDLRYERRHRGEAAKEARLKGGCSGYETDRRVKKTEAGNMNDILCV